MMCFLAADQPTWENLIPWIIGFCFTMVSGVLIVVLKDFRADLKEVKIALDLVRSNQDTNAKSYLTAIDVGTDTIVKGQRDLYGRQDKMANALFLMTKENLIAKAAEAGLHVVLRQECERMVKEADEAMKG